MLKRYNIYELWCLWNSNRNVGSGFGLVYNVRTLTPTTTHKMKWPIFALEFCQTEQRPLYCQVITFGTNAGTFVCKKYSLHYTYSLSGVTFRQIPQIGGRPRKSIYETTPAFVRTSRTQRNDLREIEYNAVIIEFIVDPRCFVLHSCLIPIVLSACRSPVWCIVYCC